MHDTSPTGHGGRRLPGGRYRGVDGDVFAPAAPPSAASAILRAVRRIGGGLRVVRLTVFVGVSHGLLAML